PAVSRRTPVAASIRRSVQPNCPRAMTWCFFASLKMLAMLAQEPSSLAPRQRLERLLPMAGFQVSMYGRFWVSTEGSNDFFTLSHTNHARHKDYAPSPTKEAMGSGLRP